MASCVRNTCTKNYQNLIIGFQVTIKNVTDVFLGHSVLVNNSDFASISHRFRDTVTYSLKLSIENCGQTAEDGNVVILTAPRQLPIRW